MEIFTGDGWAVGRDGSRRWGVLGAAGLFLVAPPGSPSVCHSATGAAGAPGVPGSIPDVVPAAPRPEPTAPDSSWFVLMQHRALWTNRGGTWALPGGALDAGESPAQAALRETWEEAGVPPEAVEVLGELVTSRVETDHALVREPVGESAASGVEERLSVAREIARRGGDVRAELAENPVLDPATGDRVVYGLDGGFWWERADSRVREWRYTTVLGALREPVELNPTAESLDLRWTRISEVPRLKLMPEFAASLPGIVEHLERGFGG